MWDSLRIVNQDVNVLELDRQRAYQVVDLDRIGNIQLEWQDLDAITNFIFDLLLHLFQGINPPRGENQLEALGRSSGEF